MQKAPIAFAFLFIALFGTMIAYSAAKKIIYNDGLHKFETTSKELRSVLISRVNRTIDLPVSVAKGISTENTKGELDEYMKSLELESRYPGVREAGIYSTDGKNLKRFYRYSVSSGSKIVNENDLQKSVNLRSGQSQNEAFILKLQDGEVNYIILAPIENNSYFFIIFDATSVLNRLFIDNSIFNNIDFKIYDAVDPGFAIFETNTEPFETNEKTYTTSQLAQIGTYPWTLVTYGNQLQVVSITAQRMPLVVLLSGFAISFLVFGILWSLSWSRKNAIYLAEEMTKNLRLSEEKYRNIFESLQDVYYRTDLEGNIVTISPSIENYVSLKPESVIGQNASLFYQNPKDRELLLKNLTEKGSVKDYPITLIGKDNLPIFCSLNARFVKDDANNLTGVEGILRDISDRKMASDALKERTRELERLNSLMINRELRMIELKAELKKYGKE